MYITQQPRSNARSKQGGEYWSNNREFEVPGETEETVWRDLEGIDRGQTCHNLNPSKTRFMTFSASDKG